MKNKLPIILILFIFCKPSLAQINKTFIELVIINKTDSCFVIPYSTDDRSKFEFKASQDTFFYFLPPIKPDIKIYDLDSTLDLTNIKITPVCSKRNRCKNRYNIPQHENLSLPNIIVICFDDNTYVFTKKRKRYYLVHGSGRLFGK